MKIKSQIEEALHKPAARWHRFLRDVFIDTFIIVISLWFSYALALGSFKTPLIPAFWVEGLVLSVISVGLLLWRGIYSINVRYLGLGDFLNIAFIGVLLTLSLATMESVLPGGFARQNVLLEPLLLGFLGVSLLSGVRIGQRVYSWKSEFRDPDRAPVKRRRTLIVGAGDAGEMITREINRSPHPVHRVVGFIDDDPEKASLRIHSIRVLGTTEDIPALVQQLNVEELLIALPSASGDDMRRVNDLCQKSGARVRTLPPVKTLLQGGPHLYTQVREVELEDLLRREPVQTDLRSIEDYIGGERVLITGGGGSIGSELARQISSLDPASLILLGKGENSIYEIEQELVQTNKFEPTCLIADVRDRQSMDRAFDVHKPTVVFHAAAHKHVPLMQGNPIEAIRNNVWGTWQTAELAINNGAKRFIYVSTDKAVKPSSIMGATKRVGEMIICALASRSETEFGIVRFGNVMGSRGSLIPLLKAQIRRGGPVRVTHRDMTRYFMTIPEAVQLILQAGAIGEHGEIFLLDMGEPIKILDLANDLIRLSGLSPGDDIEIQFTGVRPGEKIHEELLYEEEALTPTVHPKIRVVKNGTNNEWEWLKSEVLHLLDLCDQGKAEEARHCLMELAWGKSASSTFPISTGQAAVSTNVL